jgi:CRISPR/Cas system-associated exonuclease Cas4 (RecB family)
MSEETNAYLGSMLARALNNWDSRRARSKQVEIGPSQIGGCRRQVYYQLIDAPKLHSPDKLASIMGTAIHEMIAQAIKSEDPFGDNFLIEQELDDDGLPAHTDLYIRNKGLVVDWKTTTKAGQRYFPSEQQIMQVNLYAYILEKNGETPKEVSLVSIARDGKFEHIKTHSEPYNRELAESGLKWLEEVKESAEKKEIPDPEKPKHFCFASCQWYDATGEVGCASMRRS